MSEFKNLTLEVADGIAVLAISRPAALNALNSETLDELNVCLSEIEANDDIKAVILTGGPDKKGNEFKSFVAGADIAEMVNFTAPEARAFGIKASEPFFKLMNMRQVTIAAVNGFALGGGCEISMACDIRIASENAIFGQPECGLGIIPGFGGTQRLARLVGMGRAKEMIFTCDNVDANEAYRIGLVNKVVAKEELMPLQKLGCKVRQKLLSVATTLFTRPDAVCFVCIYIVTGKDHFFCTSHTYQTGKSLCTTESRNDSKTTLWLSEDCILTCDTDITCHRDLTSSA